MKKSFFAAALAALWVLVLGATMTVASNLAMANPEMAKKTGQPCTQCHTTPPALNDYGQKYKEGLKK
jgi:hypothetical protein